MMEVNHAFQAALFDLRKEERNPCVCGCGKLAKPGRKFLLGHNQRNMGRVQVALRGGKKDAHNPRMRAFTESEKDLIAHRLFFPERDPDESEGDYRFRKFEIFCSDYCVHVAGPFAGLPVILMKWQRDVLQKLFGTLDENFKRVYKKFFLHISRKNGKTFLLCLLILYWLCEESFFDRGTEILSCAATRDQSAKLIFRPCKMIIHQSQELSQLLKIRSVPASITNRLNDAIFEPLSAEGKTNLGRNPSLIIFDETLAQPNSELWDAMMTAQGLREQPLFISASTAGESRASFYYTIYEQIKQIQAKPESAPDTLVSIYEIPEEMDWQLPEAFLLANPAAGDGGFRDPEEIKSMLTRAVKSEGKAAFRQFYLNQWAQHGARTLVPLDKFDACCVDDIDIESLSDCRVVGGLDWSQTTDLTSLGLIIEIEKGKPQWLAASWSWLAGESLAECSRRDKLPYEKWVDDEVVFFDGKPTIEVTSVLNILGGLKAHFRKMRLIGFDPYLKDATAQLEPYFEMVPIPQQFQFLSPATKLIKAKTLEGNLKHESNPLLRAAFENARILTDPNGNIRLDKSRSMSRIDPLVALVIAAAVAIKTWR